MTKTTLLIERVEIEAFKSISSAEISLSPLTVVTGQNSAGKSSLLQAVRLCAHLSSLRGGEGAVQLNAPELRLGDFGDILHKSAGREVRINLQISGEHPATRWGYILGARSNRVGAQLEGMELFGREEGLVLARRAEDDDSSDLWKLSEQTETYGGASDTLRRLGFARDRNMTSASAGFEGSIRTIRSIRSGSRENRPVRLAEIAGALPAELLEEHSYARSLARSYVQELREDDWLFAEQSFFPGDWQLDFEHDLHHYLADRLGSSVELDIEESDERPSASGNIPAGAEPEWWRDQERLVERHIKQLIELNKIPPGTVLDELESDDLDDAKNFVRSLPERIHYLGPLRSEPAASLPAGHSTSGLALLGTRGESAVPFLFEYQDLEVSCPMPDGRGTEEMPLLRAVGVWLEALGIAERHEIQPVSQSLEYRLIDPQTKEKRDLTSVGVGASQILPVLVLCLAAKPGELVLLEQPELHLHPRPQQILGDFFLGIARTGRQLLLETHSEYLINRLRLRLAEQPDEVSALTSILYAERTAGATDFLELRPNDFGGFEDWPSGFFDQLPAEAEKIVRAAAERRREQARLESS
ncbi:MAG: AAA family ATPase [Acidimicrobiia bacterium]|nr:AAA family ATPase [Acidimicrobiia bacterium]